MTSAAPDSVVKLAISWFEKENRSHGRANHQDTSILVYRMVSTFPLTMAQYWEVANTGRDVGESSYMDTWLSSQVWQRLTDWDGTGQSLRRLIETASKFWPTTRSGYHTPSHMTSLRQRAALLAPAVSWDGADLQAWYADLENSFTVWGISDVRSLSKNAQPHLLEAYLRRTGVHDRLELKVVQALIAGKRWTPDLLQRSISSYMAGNNGKSTSQTMLVLGTWFDTLEWTPVSASRHINHICELLEYDYSLKLWSFLMPRIGKALACLANRPGEISHLGQRVSESSKANGASKLVGSLIAAVDAELPDVLVLEAIAAGGILSVLSNTQYPMARRLEWLAANVEKVLMAGDLPYYLKHLECPLKGGIALWCFLQATGNRASRDEWIASGLTRPGTAKRQFLELHAPELLDKIGIIESLALSYPAALDMYLSSQSYGGPQTPAELPDMAESLTC